MMILETALNNKLDDLIDELFNKIKISCIILASVNGQLITYRKTQEELNHTNLAVLFASDLGATNEISREIFEESEFDYHLHEGKKNCIFLSSILKNYVLGIIFNNSVQIGVVRLHAKKLCEKIANVITAEGENHKYQKIEFDPDANVVKSWAEQCDNLFGL